MKINFTQDYILLAWASAEKNENRNFGDELAWYIVSQLSKKEIIKADFIPKNKQILHFIKCILLFRFTRAHSYFMQIFSEEYLLSVGSILSFAQSDGAIVWGSGIIGSNVHVKNFDFRAVRGPITRNRLLELRYNVPEIYGDPALLLPLIYKSKTTKFFKLGIVPHIIHESFFTDISEDISIISLRGSDIHSVIEKICSCDYIISTSLHGIIVAHAYGIPAVWLSLKEQKLLGDDIKFYDYFHSVNFWQKEPIIYNEFFVSTIKNGQYLLYFDGYNTEQLNHAIIQRQLDLLDSAPFEIKINV